mgnify:CR=1 FL=1
MDKDEKLNKDIINRLKRIEGQVKGIQGMVDKNVCCDDILIQVLAVRSAIKMELSKTSDEDSKANIKHLADNLLREKLSELREEELKSLSESRFEETREQLLADILSYFKI